MLGSHYWGNEECFSFTSDVFFIYFYIITILSIGPKIMFSSSIEEKHFPNVRKTFKKFSENCTKS